jgi:hypothetical protein
LYNEIEQKNNAIHRLAIFKLLPHKQNDKAIKFSASGPGIAPKKNISIV